MSVGHTRSVENRDLEDEEERRMNNLGAFLECKFCGQK